MLRGRGLSMACPERATEGGLRGAESGKSHPYIDDMAMFLSPLPVECWSGIV